MPSLSSAKDSLSTGWTHIVATHNRTGTTLLYLDGKLAAQRHDAGRIDNWNDNFKLAVANELNASRPWLPGYPPWRHWRRSKAFTSSILTTMPG